MEEIADIVNTVNTALESANCVKEPGKPLCLDFFIMADRAFILGGDNRDFDPDAGYRSSRVQVYLDPITLQYRLVVSKSHWAFGNSAATVYTSIAPAHYQPGDIQFTRHVATGEVTVSVKLFNSFCFFRFGCPAIDAFVRLTPNATRPGGYEVSWVRDGFPSMGVYRRKADDSGWDTLAQDPERLKGPWLSWLGLIDEVRYGVQLPPQCLLQ